MRMLVRVKSLNTFCEKRKHFFILNLKLISWCWVSCVAVAIVNIYILYWVKRQYLF